MATTSSNVPVAFFGKPRVGMLEYGRADFWTVGRGVMHSRWDVGMEEPCSHVGMLGWRTRAFMLGCWDGGAMHSRWDAGMEEPCPHIGMLGRRNHVLMLGVEP